MMKVWGKIYCRRFLAAQAAAAAACAFPLNLLKSLFHQGGRDKTHKDDFGGFKALSSTASLELHCGIFFGSRS